MDTAMSSANGTEVELKLRVQSASELMKIAHAAGGAIADTALQENIFFDTRDNDLARVRSVLRVRTESFANSPSKAFITLKGASQKSKDGTLTTVPEEECSIEPALVGRICRGDADPLWWLLHDADRTQTRPAVVQRAREAVGDKVLLPSGGFVNERTRVAIDFPESFSAVLELDRVFFPGAQVHHEVEMEIPSTVDAVMAQRAFEALFVRAGVVGVPALGKARRFFLAMQGQKLDGALQLRAGRSAFMHMEEES
jgi:CYTH domain